MLASTQEHMLRQLAHALYREGCVKGPILQIAPMETNANDHIQNRRYLFGLKCKN
jgi:hypothetical protein